MEIKTKFDVGDIVYYINKDSIRDTVCDVLVDECIINKIRIESINVTNSVIYYGHIGNNLHYYMSESDIFALDDIDGLFKKAIEIITEMKIKGEK